MKVSISLGKILLATLLVSALFAAALAPAAGLVGVAVNRASNSMQSDINELEAGNIPGVSTVRDASGEDMAYIFNQRRHPVESDQISDFMKSAMVSIEDERFYEHDGIDFQGNFRALLTNLMAGGIAQGASTIHQQYVKNYLLLVAADSDEERAKATEQSLGRKLREIRMAVEIDKKLSKDEILTNYLNLVPFGNHAYGIEAAAQTYFDIPAAELNLEQSAMLAGMVQASERLNPYTNEEGATERRNLVLQTMVDNGYIEQADADQAKQQPLGIVDSPETLSNGCIGAGDRGFFCDYAVDYLDQHGIDLDEIKRGGYIINTTLDPQIQDAAKAKVNEMTSPTEPGVAEVMNVVKPSPTDREVLAMVSSRTYGLNADNYETILPQPNSQVGNGAGSVFKVFTAAAAIEAGYGIKSMVDVPRRYEAKGLGNGGAEGCPPDTYCVENTGSYKPTMTLEEALAESPNTAFIKLVEQVGMEAVVNKSVDLGLRSYAKENSYSGDGSLADFAKAAPLGSYTLGPTAVNPLELANVGATIASGGTWCEPNPISSVTDRYGNEVYVESPPCERAMEKDAADALANAMTADTEYGTGAQAANIEGFTGRASAKTGTTESNQSAAFLGFNSGMAAAPYIFNDGTSTSSLCSAPVRQCENGGLFGGNEPARTFYGVASQVPHGTNGNIANYDREFDGGRTNPALRDIQGKTEQEARTNLEGRGFKVEVSTTASDDIPRGRVVRAITGPDGLDDGAKITIQVSSGPSQPPAPAPSGQPGNAGGDGQPPARQPGRRSPDSLFSPEALDDIANQLRDAFGL